ncbi:MAG: hypothetical protein LC768_10675 [Acidobacteria bacterium]|nr:hypothetical protein [Acidobacteriota bacterium]MCA1638778.1 hypothetical protein [Acidobacteriota bacterium]
MPKPNNKETALNALLNSASIAEAAQTSGLSERTLYRFLEDAEFQTEYRNARRRVFEQNIVRLQSLHSGAIDTLERNLTCENPSVEVRAAQIIIEGNRKDFETLDILERMEKLEDAIEESAKENG